MPLLLPLRVSLSRTRVPGLAMILLPLLVACSSKSAGPSDGGVSTGGQGGRATAIGSGGSSGGGGVHTGISSGLDGGPVGGTSILSNTGGGIADGGGGGFSGQAGVAGQASDAGHDAVVPDGGVSSDGAGLADSPPAGGRSDAGGVADATGSGGSGGGTGFVPCPGATQTLSVGSGQKYPTVQAAVNAVPSGNEQWVQIKVKAGTYDEQVTINKPFICLVGEGATTTTIAHTIDNNISTGGTVLVKANDFSAADITFQNTRPKGEPGGQNQAVALMAQGQRQQFRNCRFLSYQDTLLTNTGTQYFRDCFIQGSVDYIFGEATAVFENCTMNNIAEGSAVTAPRTPQAAPFGFVFLGGKLTAAADVGNNKVNLGRPWGPYAAAAFLNVNMGAHITTEGWTTMSGNTLALTRFSEYKSTGPGAGTSSSTRSSRQLTAAQAASYTVAKVLGDWTPGYSQ